MTPEAQELVLRMQKLLDSNRPRNPYYSSDDEWEKDIRKKITEIKNNGAVKRQLFS